MNVYERAEMIARQFTMVLEHHANVPSGTIVLDVAQNVVAINPEDAKDAPPCSEL